MKLVQKNLMTTTLLLPSNFRFLLLLCFLPLLIACKNNSTPVQESNYIEEENVVHIPEDFPEFYTNFHLDPEFQLKHVQFPLAGKSETEKWESSEWEFHKPFNDNNEFHRDINNFGGIITETIVDNQGLFFIVRRFAKLASGWHLIYYNVGTKMDGFTPEENQ